MDRNVYVQNGGIVMENLRDGSTDLSVHAESFVVVLYLCVRPIRVCLKIGEKTIVRNSRRTAE